MTEEFLVVGRPPQPPRRGRGLPRGPRLVLAVALALAGWAVWRGVGSQPSATPTPPAPTGTAPGRTSAAPAPIADMPPAVPYLRAGTLVMPDGRTRGIPDGGWTQFVVLTDGRVVLAEVGGVTVLGPGGERRGYAQTGGLTARPDGTAVAWTGPDGRVRRLDAGPAGSAGSAAPVVVPGARQLVPTCRGLVAGGRAVPGWQTCDRDGGRISPDGRYFASVQGQSVTLAPRADITSGVATAFLGNIVDGVWEDSGHLLAVLVMADAARLVRVSVLGATEDVIAPVHGRTEADRPVLVLPMTPPPVSVQP
jgi:hypothetical protein